MKKKILLFTVLLAVCVVIAGCGKEKEEDVEDNPVDGGWEIVLTDKQVGLEEADIKLFNDAKEGYVGMDLEPIALLGTQVVAGTNYMFLAKGTPVVQNPESSYKVVVIYKDLQGNTSISKVNDFDYTKYVSKDIESNATELVGGWTTEAPGKLNVLDDENAEAAWEKATETLTGMSFNPIAIVGKQVVAGTNYAVLSYAKGSYEGSKEEIYLVTLYDGVDGTKELSSIAYVDLADFNK